MSRADRTGRDAAGAILQILRADLGDEPILGDRRCRVLRSSGRELDARQRELRGAFVLWTANAPAFVVEERYALLGAWQRVVPAIGLLPVPGGAVSLAAGFLASHENPHLSRENRPVAV